MNQEWAKLSVGWKGDLLGGIEPFFSGDCRNSAAG
jgi:hypothetical protein